MAPAKPPSATYVYGVVRGRTGSRARVRGILGKPVRVVEADGLAALTSEVPDADLPAGKDELLAHAHVLEKALDRGPVLPMRFGVVMPGDDAVRAELLEAHREELSTQLDDLADLVEVNVKGLYDEATVLRELVLENREIADLRRAIQGAPEQATYYERIRLGELVADALADKRQTDEAAVLDRLSRHAAAVVPNPPVHERMAVNASFLVNRHATNEFDGELEDIAAANHPRIGFRLTGPLPPHSFVELTVGS